MTPLSVLVIEDDAMVGLLLVEMLEDIGYTVCAVAATEDDAVAAAARWQPGVVVADEHLRDGGSGTRAMGRISRARPVPCVFMSGAPRHPAVPGQTVLLKPFQETDLVRAINSATGREAA